MIQHLTFLLFLRKKENDFSVCNWIFWPSWENLRVKRSRQFSLWATCYLVKQNHLAYGLWRRNTQANKNSKCQSNLILAYNISKMRRER